MCYICSITENTLDLLLLVLHNHIVLLLPHIHFHTSALQMILLLQACYIDTCPLPFPGWCPSPSCCSCWTLLGMGICRRTEGIAMLNQSDLCYCKDIFTNNSLFIKCWLSFDCQHPRKVSVIWSYWEVFSHLFGCISVEEVTERGCV